MAKPPGLRKRGGSWEMRVRVPVHLKAHMGRGEIVKSLGGVSVKDARRLGWDARAEIERRFEQADVELGLANAILPPPPPPASLAEEQLTEIAKRFLRELEATAPAVPVNEEAQLKLREAIHEDAYNLGRPDAAEDATVQAAAENFATAIGLALPEGPARFPFYEAVQEGWLEHLERQALRLQGRPVITVNPAFLGVDGAHGGENIGITLREAVERYIRAPERSGNTDSTAKMDRSRLGAMCDIVGGNRPVRSITRDDMRHYLDQLIKLPARHTQRFPGMTVAEAIAEGERQNAPTLSATSIKRDIQATTSLFSWLEKEELIGKNPALNLKGPKAPKKSTRRPFSRDEMQKLLRATSIAARNGQDWAYWCARINMLQGFRLVEPLGLQAKDLIKQGDVWTFRLRENEFRDLKTEETARDVPVHPRLLELGILALLEGKKPDDLLLGDVPQGKGRAFNAAQKQMSRILRKNVSSDPDLVFHSLRHSFRDEMRDHAFPRGVEERLGGWKISSDSAMDGYGRGYKLEALKEWLAKVSFDGLEID